MNAVLFWILHSLHVFSGLQIFLIVTLIIKALDCRMDGNGSIPSWTFGGLLAQSWNKTRNRNTVVLGKNRRLLKERYLPPHHSVHTPYEIYGLIKATNEILTLHVSGLIFSWGIMLIIVYLKNSRWLITGSSSEIVVGTQRLLAKL